MASGIKRAQIKYFFLATAIGFSGGSTNFLPAFGLPLYPVLNMTVSWYSAIMAYAILKYHLLDIRLVIGKTIIYFLSFAPGVLIGF